MIFVLDIILVLNLLVALRCFKNLVAPPVLMGLGMLAASLVATTWYGEWRMDRMLGDSVLVLGGGTCAFTFYCILLSRFIPSVKLRQPRQIDMAFLDEARIRKFYYFTIAIGVLGLFLQVRYMYLHFGMSTFSDLLGARRADHWSGDNTFKMPVYVRLMGSYTSVVAYLSAWLLSLSIFSPKSKRVRGLRVLLVVHLQLALLNGSLNGTKGSVLAVVTQLAVLVMTAYYAAKGSFHISRRALTRILLVAALVFISFRSLNIFIGRDYSETQTNIDLFSEYCGAEIKNFDIYMQEHSVVVASDKWGYQTFYALYHEINPRDIKAPGEFQYVGVHDLGNVYTQFRPFHEDFGFVGVFLMPLVIAVIAMFFYGRSQLSLLYPTRLRASLLIYASMAMSIFMSFFSSKFTENVMYFGGIRSYIYIAVLVFFAKRFLFVKTRYKR